MDRHTVSPSTTRLFRIALYRCVVFVFLEGRFKVYTEVIQNADDQECRVRILSISGRIQMSRVEALEISVSIRVITLV